MSDLKISDESIDLLYCTDLISDSELYDMTYLELVQLVQETKEARNEVEAENVFLENYLQNQILQEDPSPNNQEGNVAFYRPISVELLHRSPIPSISSSTATSFTEKRDLLPMEQKCEIAAWEINTIKQKLTKLHVNWFNSVTPYKVASEELTLETQDLQLDYAKFTRDVMVDGVNADTGLVMLEKVHHFFQRSCRDKDGQIQRCRRDHSNLLKLERKIEEQLKVKPDLGSMLKEIDYDQLKIENASLSETIEDKDKALQKIKYFMTLMVHYLNQYKGKLKQALTLEQEIKDRIEQQSENIEKLQKEIQLVQAEEIKMTRDVSNLKNQLNNYRFPDVSDYIHTQAEIYEMNKILKVWKRRVNIASRSHNAKSKYWSQLKKKVKVDDSLPKVKADEVLPEDPDLITENEFLFRDEK